MDKSAIDDLFLSIPEGMVEMRDDRIKKVWQVEVAGLELAKYPVTQSLFESVTNRNPSTFKGKNLPVETVTWIEAIEFCNQLSEQLDKRHCYNIDRETNEITIDSTANGFRLPTEAEWQYACQAGNQNIRYGELDEIAWYKANSENSTQIVGKKAANDWGLHDMLGNVWEWCSDIYDAEIYGSYRVFRGGGWGDVERSVMATTRRRSHPYSFKIEDLGFRIVKNQVRG